MGWLIVLGILILLAVMPLGVSVLYDSAGALVWIIAGPIRLKVFPFKNKGKNETARKEKKGVVSKKVSQKTPEKQGGKLMDFMPIIHLVLDLLTDFRRKLRIDRLEANVVLAGDDPCDMAINYGRAWAALGNLWPRLEELFIIKKRDVQVQCDFSGSETLVKARLDLTITLGGLLLLGGRYGIRTIKEFMKLKNKGKGGAAI